MTKLPPEILAIPLPDGMKWTVYANDPCVTNGDERLGWVNCEGTTYHTNNSMAVYIQKRVEYYSYVDHEPPLTVIDLCKILATHLWIDP